jgi:hypothetical protein
MANTGPSVSYQILAQLADESNGVLTDPRGKAQIAFGGGRPEGSPPRA